MLRFTIALTLAAAFAVTSSAVASPVTGTYNDVTGEITVSVIQANSWYVEWTGGDAMTGDAPLNLPAAAGIVTDNDTRIGEATFAPFDFANTLGNVAVTGLLDDDTLRIFWNTGLGNPPQSVALSFGPLNFPPTAGITGPNSVNIFGNPQNVLFDASSSTDDGLLDPLTYEWDLDNNGTYEFDTHTNPTLAIADVNETFGGTGDYPVAVRVFDGQLSDTAFMTLNLFSEPPSLANPGFEIPETTATGQFPTTFGDWAGDISEIVTFHNGVFPAEGDQMLHFLNTSPVGPAFPGTSSDVWQLVDVSSLATDITAGRVVIEVSALFNRTAGDLESDTAFRIKIDALDGVPADFFDKKVAGSELATSVSEIITDGEFWTWEMADTSLLLPAGTEYIAIMVNAVENTVNDGVAPEFDGHYADDVVLTVNFVEPSDLNLDGFVDAADAGIMFGNWGPTTLGYFDGNLNGDGFIDAADAGIMYGNWTGDVGPAAITIPEPSSLLLAGFAGMLFGCRRRRV